MAVIIPVIKKIDDKDAVSVEEWNQSVNEIKDNLSSAQKSLDSINENLDSAKKTADRILDIYRKRKYHSKTGEDLKEVIYEKIKKDMSINIDNLNNAISLQCVIDVLHDYIQEKNDIMKQTDHEYNKEYDTYSLGNAFLIKLIFSNSQKLGLDSSKNFVIVDFQIIDLNQHKDIKIIVDLAEKSIYHVGCADKLFEEELNLKFDYDYIINHIYVDIDKMPLCIQEELYKIKKEQLEKKKQANNKETKKIKLQKLKKLFSILNKNKKSKEFQEKNKKL